MAISEYYHGLETAKRRLEPFQRWQEFRLSIRLLPLQVGTDVVQDGYGSGHDPESLLQAVGSQSGPTPDCITFELRDRGFESSTVQIPPSTAKRTFTRASILAFAEGTAWISRRSLRFCRARVRSANLPGRV